MPSICERALRAAVSLGGLTAALLGVACDAAGIEVDSRSQTVRLDGDVGPGVFQGRRFVKGADSSPVVAPFLNVDYGRAFVRIDTFGIKTLKMGYGHLEVCGRVELDGFKADAPALRGLADRRNSLPLGIGTLQETPWGAFFVNAFRDAGKSKGTLADLTYAGQVSREGVTIFPQVGVEYLSHRYVGYYFGISAEESRASGYSTYRPGSAINPFVGALIEARITGDWYLDILVRHRWLAGSIRRSPIVAETSTDSAFVALAYRFH